MKFQLLSLLSLTASTLVAANIFTSQKYINHSLAFKQPKLCDSTVVQYSGYLDVGKNEHYFFWFFESRKNPEKAPLTVWLNGGPGCSSMIGLWQELGPCRVNQDGTKAIYNEEGSWNQVSNMLFFDQPDGVGFSHGVDNVYSTDDAAPLSYRLLQVFFEAFPKYKDLDFHFYGESYGGHYVPAFADYILKQNLALTKHSKNQRINLKSIGVGNGFTDPLIQNQYYEKMACDSSYGSVLSPSDCKKMKDHTPECVRLSQKCYKTGTNHDCIKADNYCGTYVEGVYDNANKSYYDVRTSQEIPSTYIKFLNTTSTMNIIGAKQWYQECADIPGNKFYKTGDDARNFAPRVANLLNHGVRVLLYAGDADYICNWYGNHAWAQQLNFKGSKAYRKDKLKPWLVDGKEVGQYQAGGNLTFVRVYEAGHEVPYYQPKAALAMFTNAVESKSFGKH
ncbi:prepro-carboxypeptidase Z [Halteromyces radiatus]|uniref:prepro-carboxypeptidase Z n=1 Tax=Halteromyces radiatus TaxID=101107 RepID=UPI0022206742|nr:prepro-carboxypeptidase Z [Halteromyces radiatus]KAI8098799.1 prepro-carboxypeptidase Z [Halteromyces radiatus]